MRAINRICVVLEPQQDEQPALDRAVYIARATNASLHLFLCAYDRAIGIASFLSGNQKSVFIKTMVDGSEVLLERKRASLLELGLEVTTEVVWNRHPTDAILKAAVDCQCDLLMKYARSHSRAEIMFNHIDWNLMRYSACPVMLVKTGQWDEVGQVLASIDAAPETDLHRQLNHTILATASYLASQLAFELHLVCAYPPPPVFVPVSRASTALVSYRSRMSQMVNQNLRALGLEYGVQEEHLHAIEGPVDWVIPKVSEDLVAEFVVMGNVSRESMSGKSIGSTAESILDQLNTNVLMVRINESPA